MPKRKPALAPTQSSVSSPEPYSLSFTIETFDDPETGKPTQYGRFSRHWQDEEALDVLIDKLEAGARWPNPPCHGGQRRRFSGIGS